MHEELTQNYSPPLVEEDPRPLLEGTVPVGSDEQALSMSQQASQGGDSVSMGSNSTSPSPSATPSTSSAGRNRSRSGTMHLTMQQLNKKRQRATPDQLVVLEEAFHINPSPNAKMRELIANQIRMTERSVQIWFQNRRAKVKLIQRKEAESDDGSPYFRAPGTAHILDPNRRAGIMRSNSVGHGSGYTSLPPEIRFGLRTGFGPGSAPLTPAASPSSKTVIQRLSVDHLSIGTWHRVACTSMDLVIYFSPMEGRFTYYINSGASGFKIEFPLTSVIHVSLQAVIRKEDPAPETSMSQSPMQKGEGKQVGRLVIELHECPVFFMEHRTAGGWRQCTDFTEGHAASVSLTHTLVGPYAQLAHQLPELAAMSPILNQLLHNNLEPIYIGFDSDGNVGSSAGESNRRHSSVANVAAGQLPMTGTSVQSPFQRPGLPASHSPHISPHLNSHLAPQLGVPRPRPSFQAHRRTRSRSLPTAVNVSDLALHAHTHGGATPHIGSNAIPGVKFGADVGQYISGIGHQDLYSAQSSPLRIDTSVADSVLDYYRQFTPASSMSNQLTPVDFGASPNSQISHTSALSFHDVAGNEYRGGSLNPASTNLHPSSAAWYSSENLTDPTTMYSSEDVSDIATPSQLMGLDQYHPEQFTYAESSVSQDRAGFLATGRMEHGSTMYTESNVGLGLRMEVDQKAAPSEALADEDKDIEMTV